MIFRENMIFKLNQEKYRIIGSDVLRNDIFIIELCEKTKWPQVIELNELSNLFNSNEAIEINDIRYMSMNNAEITQEMIKKRDFYYEIICFLIQNSAENEIFYSKSRKVVIDKAIEKYKLGYSSIKKVFCNYLKSGKILDSLTPKYYNCGGKGKERIVHKNQGVTIDSEVRRFFRQGINKYYNTTKKNTIKTCYELIIRDYLKANPNSELPTLKQFYYWHSRLTKDNKRNEISKRQGDRIYQQKGRAIIGNSLQDAGSPAELYQIDSTILDVYIVSKLNRNLIVGRPILYLVIDVYSRMIVGMNVTIEPFNSYQGVQGALINAMSSKVSYCKKYGIDIMKEEWDISCTPSRILADRGELLSGNIENVISNLGIMIQNTPPYRGDMKGIVEKSFERIHSYIKPFVDGVVENKFNKVERGDEDYRLKANLTLEEITKIIIRCVLFHNNNHVLNHYESDGLNIENSIAKIPNKIWEYGVKQKKGLLRELPEEVIKINLLNNKEATVSSKGVRMNKLYYVSKYTLEEGWFQRARIQGSFKIRVSYDPNNISEIYYIKEDGLSYDALTLASYQEHYKDLSEEELKKISEYEEKLNKEAGGKEIIEKINLFDEIEKITKKAKEEKERVADKKITKTARLKNIRENLEQERQYYRNNEESKSDEEIRAFDEIIMDEWGKDYE